MHTFIYLHKHSYTHLYSYSYIIIFLYFLLSFLHFTHLSFFHSLSSVFIHFINYHMIIQKKKKSLSNHKRRASSNRLKTIIIDNQDLQINKLKEIAQFYQSKAQKITLKQEGKINSLFTILMLFPKVKIIEDISQQIEISSDLREEAMRWEKQVGETVVNFITVILEARQQLIKNKVAVEKAERSLNVLRISFAHFQTLVASASFYMLNQHIIDLTKEASSALQTILLARSDSELSEDSLQYYLAPNLKNAVDNLQCIQQRQQNRTKCYNHIHAINFYEQTMVELMRQYYDKIDDFLNIYEQQLCLSQAEEQKKGCPCTIIHFCLDRKWMAELTAFVERRMNGIIAKLAIYVEVKLQSERANTQQPFVHPTNTKQQSNLLSPFHHIYPSPIQDSISDPHQLGETNQKKEKILGCQKLINVVNKVKANIAFRRLKKAIRPQYVYIFCGIIQALQRQRKDECLDRIFLYSLAQEQKQTKNRRMRMRRVFKAWRNVLSRKKKLLRKILRRKIAKDKAWQSLLFVEWRLAARNIVFQNRMLQSKFLLRVAVRPTVASI